MGFFSGLFGKNEKETNFRSPMKGRMLTLDDVPDPAFSSRSMGDGYAVELEGGTVAAPFDGTVTACFPTGHAYGITSPEGVEVLLHIGLDTVELGGRGFDCKVEAGRQVKQGDILVEVDSDAVRAGGKSLISPVIFTSGQRIKALKIGRQVDVGEIAVLEYR